MESVAPFATSRIQKGKKLHGNACSSWESCCSLVLRGVRTLGLLVLAYELRLCLQAIQAPADDEEADSRGF